MSEQQERPERPSLGIYDRPAAEERVTVIEKSAIALSVVWLAVAAVFFLLAPAGPDGSGVLRFAMIVLVVFLPVAMIWVAASAARASKVMREESARLQGAIDALRQSYVAQAQARSGGGGIERSVARKLDEIAAVTRKTETALATFHTTRQEAAPAQAPSAPAVPQGDAATQGSLALGGMVAEGGAPLSNADFIRALNFPETAEDAEGFAALRRALRDHGAARLVQAAEDVLTLLSQDGIYMDDLAPDRARPELWRRFAQGDRSRAIAALGGVRDRSSLALTAGRMRNDSIFRDAAHHFLRCFDRTFAAFEPKATDAEIVQLTDTRTARAFMLLGRVAGTFD